MHIICSCKLEFHRQNNQLLAVSLCYKSSKSKGFKIISRALQSVRIAFFRHFCQFSVLIGEEETA